MIKNLELVRPFHELTREEFTALCETEMTWTECAERYPQPSWCSYPGAVMGEIGCWSLMDFRISGPDSCSSCELYLGEINAARAS
jgi:hypothetical protein